MQTFNRCPSEFQEVPKTPQSPFRALGYPRAREQLLLLLRVAVLEALSLTYLLLLLLCILLIATTMIMIVCSTAGRALDSVAAMAMAISKTGAFLRSSFEIYLSPDEKGALFDWT